VKNSNKPAWFAFARNISEQYQPVFIPDTECALDSWNEPFPCFRVGGIDLDMRMALYELTVMNCFVSGGPPTLCLWNSLPYLCFMQKDYQVFKKEYIEGTGIRTGADFPYADHRQRRIWESDNLDIIEREFKAIMQTEP